LCARTPPLDLFTEHLCGEERVKTVAQPSYPAQLPSRAAQAAQPSCPSCPASDLGPVTGQPHHILVHVQPGGVAIRYSISEPGVMPARSRESCPQPALWAASSLPPACLRPASSLPPACDHCVFFGHMPKSCKSLSDADSSQAARQLPGCTTERHLPGCTTASGAAILVQC